MPAVTCVEVMEEFSENSDRESEINDGTVNPNVPEALCGTGDPAVTVPRGLCSTNHNRRKKLILHVDLNNTILISDAVTGQGTVAALDYFLTTVTWGRMSKDGKSDLKKKKNDLMGVFSITRECEECHVSNNVTKSEAENSILECVNYGEMEVNNE